MPTPTTYVRFVLMNDTLPSRRRGAIRRSAMRGCTGASADAPRARPGRPGPAASATMLEAIASTGTHTASEPQAVAAAEDRALREGCGLLDRSERGKLALT